MDMEQAMLTRLEQTVAIVQQYFIAERTTTLELDLVAKQVRDCHSGPLSYGTAEYFQFIRNIFFAIRSSHRNITFSSRLYSQR
jgi:hypothetical protein